MRNMYASLLAVAGLGCMAGQAAASTFFNDGFDTPPVIGPTQAPGVWYVDRYAPKHFDSQMFGGDNRLRIGISSDDGVGANATGGGRPGGFTSTFYNTQGRKYDLGNGVFTSLKADLYVGNDWATMHRRSDMWATVTNNANVVTGYPILGMANIEGAAGPIMCRVWDAETVNGWVDVSVNVPGGITTDRWYTLEIRLKPGVYEYYVDGVLVYVDATVADSSKFADIIMQAYNFNDPALPINNQAFQESYDVYWDNMQIAPLPLHGLPVDLNGSYRSASGGPMNPSGPASVTGLAAAATIPLGSGNVFERNGSAAIGENVVNGTFTPFNDSTKVPNTMLVGNVDGTGLEADVALGGNWKPFEWGQGVGNVPPFATGDTFAVGWINGANSFGVQVVTDLAGDYVVRLASQQFPSGSIASLDTAAVTLASGTTRIRVNAWVSGGLLTGTVMPLDGPQAYQLFNLGSSNGLNMTTNNPWLLNYLNAGFIAGFETHEHIASAANATVSEFTTDAVSNVMFSFADDPYVRSSDSGIYYRVGQANLAQSITGFQAFMNAGAGQTFTSGMYAGPYTTFNPTTISALLNAAGASANANTDNVTMFTLLFGPGASETVTGTGFRPNSGNEINLFAGGPPNFSDVPALTFGSNAVLIDNTAPALGVPGLGGSGYVAPNVIVGNLEITVSSNDVGTHQSGLDGRPAGTITWSNSSVTPVSMVSLTGNTFRAVIPITSGTPNGTATLSLQVCDRAGNCTTQNLVFNVSTVNVNLTLIEKGVDINVNRVIEITVGATGGSNAPILVRREIAFNTFTNAPGVNSRQGTTWITYQDLDSADDGLSNLSVPPGAVFTLVYAKDPFFSLGKQESLSGGAGTFNATITMTMGDLTNNNVVNVSDLAVWAANNGTSQNPNTTLAQPALPRQANVDGAGTVNLGDRNLVIAAWLFSGDGNGVGNYSGGYADGRQTVAQVAAETGLPRSIVISMDLNKDGWITREEVLQWSGGGTRRR